MSVQSHRTIETGRLACKADPRGREFEMRFLDERDLPELLGLYDYIVDFVNDPAFFWRYPDDIVRTFMGEDGLNAGVFVDGRMIGFRVMYYHKDGDPENPLLATKCPPHGTAHLAVSAVHPDYQGNSLQKRMTAHVLDEARRIRPYKSLCSVVSPKNAPSVKEKFAFNMGVVTLIPKFSGNWRYIFYLDPARPEPTAGGGGGLGRLPGLSSATGAPGARFSRRPPGQDPRRDEDALPLISRRGLTGE